MHSEHPYQQSVPESEQELLNTSSIPGWHHRRNSKTAEHKLDKNKRAPAGSFDLLQDLVQEKQKQDKEEMEKLSVDQETSDKIKTFVKNPLPMHGILVSGNVESEKGESDNQEAAMNENSGSSKRSNKPCKSGSVRFAADHPSEK